MWLQSQSPMAVQHIRPQKQIFEADSRQQIYPLDCDSQKHNHVPDCDSQKHIFLR